MRIGWTNMDQSAIFDARCARFHFMHSRTFKLKFVRLSSERNYYLTNKWSTLFRDRQAFIIHNLSFIILFLGHHDPSVPLLYSPDVTASSAVSLFSQSETKGCRYYRLSLTHSVCRAPYLRYSAIKII